MDEFHLVAAMEQPDGTENRLNIGLLPVPSSAEPAHRAGERAKAGRRTGDETSAGAQNQRKCRVFRWS